MGRKNLFEVLRDDQQNRTTNIKRIDICMRSRIIEFDENLVDITRLFASTNLFSRWKGRGHCLDYPDFLRTVNYKLLLSRAQDGDEESFINYVELVLTIWCVISDIAEKYENIFVEDMFLDMKHIIDDLLSSINHTYFYDEEHEIAFVIEDKPEITAVVEIASAEIASAVLKYNHHSLKGNIKQKREILRTLYSNIEPQFPTLKVIDDKLLADIKFIANNLNIRHNNTDSTDSKNYHEVTANLPLSELELYYDELYQQILLATLELDNIERHQKLSEMRKTFK